MAIAGRVAIVPKGEYSNAVTYDKLDLVMFNNDAYIAKKASTGIEPTNDEYWMLILNNVVAEDLEKIIDGTTPVGNANKLGGKDASEYVTRGYGLGGATAEDAITETIVTDLNNATKCGWYYVSESTTNNTPDGFSKTAVVLVSARSNDTICQEYLDIAYQKSAKRFLYGGTWTEWEQTATTADLANYLPLSGGTVEELGLGNVGMIGDSGFKVVKDGSIVSYLTFSARNKRFEWWDPTNGYHCSQMLDTHNKPSGSYTGNGSTYQNVAVGGTGEFVMVSTDGKGTKSDFVIVSQNGYFGKVGGTVVQGNNMFTTSGGTLIIDGVTAFLTSGKQYRYQRL